MEKVTQRVSFGGVRVPEPVPRCEKCNSRNLKVDQTKRIGAGKVRFRKCLDCGHRTPFEDSGE